MRKDNRICVILRSMRPHHWIKNLVMFLPIFLEAQMNDGVLFLKILLGVFVFSFLASSIYILNDIIDLNYDKACPYRCNRPIAAGELRISVAGSAFMINILISLSICFLITDYTNWIKCLFIMILYLIFNYIYSVKGKNIAVLDVALIELGYFFRLEFAYALTGIKMEKSLYISVMAGILVLILSKRYYELELPVQIQRKSIRFRNSGYVIERSIDLLLIFTVIMYGFWCCKLIDIYGRKIIWTLILLMMLCIKYKYNIKKKTLRGIWFYIYFRISGVLCWR
mgnify:CR=1 FL=1